MIARDQIVSYDLWVRHDQALLRSTYESRDPRFFYRYPFVNCYPQKQD